MNARRETRDPRPCPEFFLIGPGSHDPQRRASGGRGQAIFHLPLFGRALHVRAGELLKASAGVKIRLVSRLQSRAFGDRDREPADVTGRSRLPPLTARFSMVGGTSFEMRFRPYLHSLRMIDCTHKTPFTSSHRPG
jgi:hypothetical protein